MLPQRLWRGILALLLVFAMVPSMQAQAQVSDPVLRLIEQLPTRVKVGQLAMISFPGADLENEALVQLMKDYGIGGVWLRPENGNFGATPVAASDFISLTNRLQELSWQTARGTDKEEATETPEASSVLTQTPYLPLFIGVESDVQGLPLTSFIAGTSSTPAAMALGATWSPELTEATGEVLGRELSALGVNFFLGPDLDVLYTPRSGDPADLGGGVLGGDPYWVGELGRAYIRGMHAGSGGALVVVPRHFPGLGSTDRPVQDEVPTVQKSLEQLKQIELAPFFAVTKSPPGAVDAADALLVTHIRYRGFQGNIRLSTRPISMDSQALQLAMENLRPWRDAGGLLVADNLGLQSIRRFDDPSERSFNARRVVRDALLAGNDILIMDRFAITEEWTDHFTNIRDTLEFLVQRYEGDATFRKRVDESLYRAISLKLRIYPDFALPYVMHNPDKALESLGGGENVTEQVAVSALTRLAPFSGDLLPDPPKEGDRIVIFTQEHLVEMRETGTSIPMLPRDLVRQTLLRLYGPEGTGQVRSSAVQQFTFQDLLATIENPRPEAEEPAYQTLVALQNAQWIIFATTGLDMSDTESTVLKAFLEQQAGLLNGRIVVFNFGPPYELDSTEISKLDLYYALYSPGEAFVQAGVQALFQDVPALSSSPVSIPALNYDLTFQTMPDPQQVISLMVVDENGEAMPEEELAAVRKDDMIYLQTGVILDRNGHPVPDGTPVQFILSYPQEENRTETVSDETSEGVAFTSLVLDRVGLVDITVQSEPATAVFHLQLTIREGESVIVFSFTPTPQPTEPSPTPTLQPSDSASYIPILPDPLRLPAPRRGTLLGWGLFASLSVALFGFIWIREHETGLTKALRTGLWGAIGGMSSYLLGMSAVTWVNPAWFYSLAGREFVVGGVALAGGLVVLGVLFSPWFERFVTWIARMEMRRSKRLLASGREN